MSSMIAEVPVTIAKTWMRLLGHMAAYTYVVSHARLTCQPLQRWLRSVHNAARSPLYAPLPEPVLRSLDWWRQEETVCAGIPFVKQSPSVQLFMDASDVGWGSHAGTLRTQGMWSPGESSLHVHVKELRAVRLGCQAFLPQRENKVVVVLTHSTTTMYYINKQSGAHSSPLCKEALELWELCISHNIHLEASYLPGSSNVLADRLSPSFRAHEWTIRMDIIEGVLGGVIPIWICLPHATIPSVRATAHS